MKEVKRGVKQVNILLYVDLAIYSGSPNPNTLPKTRGAKPRREHGSDLLLRCRRLLLRRSRRLLTPRIGLTHPPALLGLAITGQDLSKLAPLPDRRSLPVEDVDRDRDQDCQEGQDGRGPLELEPVADVLVHGCRVHSRDTGEEVPSETVATRGRGRVRTVRRNHVVDGGHVDCVVGHSDQGREDEGRDPVHGRGAEGGPGETEEADCEARSQEQEPVETVFRLQEVWPLCLAHLLVLPEEREEREVRKDVADQDRVEGLARGDGAKVPLGEDRCEGIEEGEDQRVAETGEEGQT